MSTLCILPILRSIKIVSNPFVFSFVLPGPDPDHEQVLEILKRILLLYRFNLCLFNIILCNFCFPFKSLVSMSYLVCFFYLYYIIFLSLVFKLIVLYIILPLHMLWFSVAAFKYFRVSFKIIYIPPQAQEVPAINNAWQLIIL